MTTPDQAASPAPPGPPPAPRISTPSGHPIGSSSARRLVVLASGGGSLLAALLAAHEDRDYGARVAAVVSDRTDAGALGLAREAGVATAAVAPRDFPDRDAWDRALTETVAVFEPDLVVSAGFMRILGAPFLGRFGGRTVNTHPALLPAFPGAHGVRDALAYGAVLTGCTLHVVDAGVDTGPIVAQAVVPVRAEDDEASLHERIKVAERALLVEWVGRICREGMTVAGRRVVVG